MKRHQICYFAVCVIAFGVLLTTGCQSYPQKYLVKAERGDVESQAKLGMSYLYGRDGFKTDYRQAFFWLQKAAAGRSPLGMYGIAVIYERGLGEVPPNPMRAERYYRLCGEIIRNRARQGDLEYIHVLAEMYYYGRGVPESREDAYRLYSYCAERAYYPSITMLGVIHYHGDGAEKNLDRARHLLIKTAERNDIVSQYYLYLLYDETGRPELAGKWLELAVGGNHPDAMLKSALLLEAAIDRKPGSEEARNLILKAAYAGQPEAQFMAADLATDSRMAEDWIVRSAERNHVPAMLRLAEILKSDRLANAVKIMTLYQLALKNDPDNPSIVAKIEDFDRLTGLFFPVMYCWQNLSGGENILLADSGIQRILDGYKAGIEAGSRELFMRGIIDNAVAFYLSNDWYRIYHSQLPLTWASDIFVALEKEKQESPGFWLTYGITAALAGQGGTQAYAASRLGQLADMQPDAKQQEFLADLGVLLKANALMLLRRDDEAYELLFANGRLRRADSPYIANFVNFWCAPLLKDKHKFSVSSGISENRLGEYRFPGQTSFYDLQLQRMATDKALVKEPEIALPK